MFLPLDEYNSWKETLYLLANPANADHLLLLERHRGVTHGLGRQHQRQANEQRVGAFAPGTRDARRRADDDPEGHQREVLDPIPYL